MVDKSLFFLNRVPLLWVGLERIGRLDRIGSDWIRDPGPWKTILYSDGTTTGGRSHKCMYHISARFSKTSIARARCSKGSSAMLPVARYDLRDEGAEKLDLKQKFLAF